VGSSRKSVKLTGGEARAAAAAAILRVANERAANNIAPIIAELRAGGATSLQDIAAGLNQRGITTARGGTCASTSVHADRQSPSIITRSPVERTLAKACRYLPTCPPGSSTMRMVADAEVAPYANMAAQSNSSQKQIACSLPPYLQIGRLAPDVFERLRRHRGIADRVGNAGMTQEVL
jgi:hypothetical protein